MGIIDQAKTPAEAAPVESAQPTAQGAAPGPERAAPKSEGSAGGLTITEDQVLGEMHLNDQQKQQVDGIVTAGKRLMYADETRQMLQSVVNSPDDDATKLGQGIAGLMGLLMSEAKGSLPMELVIPSGIVLLAHAAQFINDLGGGVTDADVGDGIEIFMSVVMQGNGLDPEKITQMGADALEGKRKPPADMQPPSAPQGGGIINQVAGA